MGINVNHLKHLIIKPTLREMGEKFNDEAAINLLLMTTAAETKVGTYLKQGYQSVADMCGVALGIYQMEPNTFIDVWERFKWKETDLVANKLIVESMSPLISDLRFSTIMARAKYYLVPSSLPEANNVEELAHYYAKYWYAGEHYEDRKQKAIKAYRELVLKHVI